MGFQFYIHTLIINIDFNHYISLPISTNYFKSKQTQKIYINRYMQIVLKQNKKFYPLS